MFRGFEVGMPGQIFEVAQILTMFQMELIVDSVLVL
jgi:hypothetical protein